VVRINDDDGDDDDNDNDDDADDVGNGYSKLVF